MLSLLKSHGKNNLQHLLYVTGCAVKSIGDKLSNKIIPFQRTEFINGDVGFVHTMYQCLEFDRLERNKFKGTCNLYINISCLAHHRHHIYDAL